MVIKCTSSKNAELAAGSQHWYTAAVHMWWEGSFQNILDLFLISPSFWNKLGRLLAGRFLMKHGVWLINRNLGNPVRNHQVKVVQEVGKWCLNPHKMFCCCCCWDEHPINLQNLSSCLYLQARIVAAYWGEPESISWKDVLLEKARGRKDWPG